MAARSSVLAILHPRRAVGRMLIAAVVGGVAAFALGLRFPPAISVVGGWNMAGIALLALAWRSIATCDEHRTADRAAAEDPGRTAVYVLVLLTSLFSLLAAMIVARRARVVTPGEASLLLALCVVTVVLSWSLTHTALTLRYAHLYYREDREGVGGIELPGGERPCYSDFAYLAFTVGMCFQVSDVTISSRQIRRAVLFHAMLSFFYNTAILAFVLNLVFGRLG